MYYVVQTQEPAQQESVVEYNTVEVQPVVTQSEVVEVEAEVEAEPVRASSEGRS